MNGVQHTGDTCSTVAGSLQHGRVLQRRHGISTGLASSEGSSRTATQTGSRKATQTRTVCVRKHGRLDNPRRHQTDRHRTAKSRALSKNQPLSDRSETKRNQSGRPLHRAGPAQPRAWQQLKGGATRAPGGAARSRPPRPPSGRQVRAHSADTDLTELAKPVERPCLRCKTHSAALRVGLHPCLCCNTQRCTTSRLPRLLRCTAPQRRGDRDRHAHRQANKRRHVAMPRPWLAALTLALAGSATLARGWQVSVALEGCASSCEAAALATVMKPERQPTSQHMPRGVMCPPTAARGARHQEQKDFRTI